MFSQDQLIFRINVDVVRGPQVTIENKISDLLQCVYP